MYGGQYGELDDYEAPPPPRTAGRRSSFERSGRASEISLDLGDLQDLQGNFSRNFSELSIAAWQDADGGRCNFEQISCSDLNDMGDEISRFAALSLDSTIQHPPVSRIRRMSGSIDLDDIPEQPDDSCTTFTTKQMGSSSFRGGDIEYSDDKYVNEESSSFHRSSTSCLLHHKRVHFAGSTSLEDVREYEKPDVHDYHLLYYMGQEIQKMMDDFKAEEDLERSIVR
jgi:hypothetical protein